jgi:hypothetical protein
MNIVRFHKKLSVFVSQCPEILVRNVVDERVVEIRHVGDVSGGQIILEQADDALRSHDKHSLCGDSDPSVAITYQRADIYGNWTVVRQFQYVVDLVRGIGQGRIG